MAPNLLAAVPHFCQVLLPAMAVLPAANLKDNEAQVPHQIMQLLSLIVDSKRSDNLFVSIYESGSTDDTGRHGLHCREATLPV